MKIVLASESPFRRRALDILGLTYEICPSGIDEKAIRDNNPADLTRTLAAVEFVKMAMSTMQIVSFGEYFKERSQCRTTAALSSYFCGVVFGPWPDFGIDASLLFKLRSNTPKRSVCGVGRSFTSCPISSPKSALGS